MVNSQALLSQQLRKHIEFIRLGSSSSKLAQRLCQAAAAMGMQRQGSLICSSPK